MYGDNTRTSSRFTTPLAAPPPPLHLLSAQQGRGTHNMHLPAYAGARHTLGPMFNDEEDGDDSAFIAQQMNLLGLNESQAAAAGRQQSGQRRRNTTASGPNPNTSNRRGNRRQARSNTQEPIPGPYDMDPSQQAATYLALQAQAQAQQTLLAAQLHSAGIDQQTQQAFAQRYQMQLQLAALQQLQLQQRQSSPHRQHMQYNQQQHKDQAYASASDQRNQLAAQVQANLLARTRRQKNLDDAETRARFEAAPNVNKDQPSASPNPASLSPFASKSRPTENLWGSGPMKPFSPEILPAAAAFAPTPKDTVESLWTHKEPPKTSTSTFTSRFGARSGSQPSSTHSSSDALFHRLRNSAEDTASTDTDFSRAEADTTAQTSPKSTESEFEADKPVSCSGLGLGRPARAWSTPASSGSPPATINVGQPRSTSYTAGASVNVLRQPFGPPGNAEKLKEENFKTIMRKRAGAGLHMLNRRASPSSNLLSLAEA